LPGDVLGKDSAGGLVCAHALLLAIKDAAKIANAAADVPRAFKSSRTVASSVVFSFANVRALSMFRLDEMHAAVQT
jgi:hypothetical protein